MVNSKHLSAPEQAELAEALELFKAHDPEVFALLDGNLHFFTTKGSGRLVASRLAKSLGISPAAWAKRQARLQELLEGGDYLRT